ncbi:MAG: peptidoglycan editing factor PgeF [Syntrophobacteraceae bacterium]
MNPDTTCDKPGFIRFRNLSGIPGLVHGIFTRHGGVSLPPYTGLNVGWNNGDSPEHVRENLNRVKQSLAIDTMIGCPQVHGDTVHIVDGKLLAGAAARPPVLVTPPGDALATNLPDVGLLIKIADCQAIFLVDPVRGAIANIHSGWRGSVQDIAGKTVRAMRDHFGSRPEDLLAAVSPSLGPCHAEFRNYRDELPPSFHPFQSRPLYFDFWAITRSQLTDAGLKDENIETAGRCTVCEPQHFFSYRGQGNTGRMAAVIALRNGSGK